MKDNIVQKFCRDCYTTTDHKRIETTIEIPMDGCVLVKRYSSTIVDVCNKCGGRTVG